MVVDRYQHDPHCREAVTRLAARFSGRVSRRVVTRTVVGARADLEGQIQPEALAEMLHHLAAHRLDTLAPGRT